MDSSAPNQNKQLTTILEQLCDGDVDFILVGGLAAVAQGAPVATQDVDIVHARTPENVDRLLSVLHKLDARYRRPGSDIIRPAAKPLLSEGHSLFTTTLGPLDCLGTIENGQSYEDLISKSLQLDVSGRTIKVLSLRAIIENKQGSSHPKDKYVLAILADMQESTE